MISQLITRLRQEPIAIVGVGIIALQAFQQAAGEGLGPEDILVAVATAVLTWLGRQLVYPAVNVEAGTRALLDAAVDEPLGEPYLGEPDGS